MQATGSEYLKFSMMSAFLIGTLPMLFRVYKIHVADETDVTFSKAVTKVILW